MTTIFKLNLNTAKPRLCNSYIIEARLAYALQSQSELALENCQKAIQIAPEKTREMAKTDSDFENIRSNPRFQELIQSEHTP